MRLVNIENATNRLTGRVGYRAYVEDDNGWVTVWSRSGRAWEQVDRLPPTPARQQEQGR